MPSARRFPCYFQFYGPEEHELGFNALAAANSLLTKSDHYRLAFETYLRQQGAIPSRPTSNGASHHPARAEAQ